MYMNKNILILSVGTRDKIVQYFREAFAGEGLVVAADCSRLAPAIYEADKYYIVPKITEDGYLEEVFRICREEKISGVLSLIDPELSLLAEHEGEFGAMGVTVVGSSRELCGMSLDKYRMYRWLCAHHYNCARSWMDGEEFCRAVAAGNVRYPVFVKPACGSASVCISEAADRETVELLLSHGEGLMVQEYLHGSEIGADVYIDLVSGEVVSIFTKRKLKMRAGETDKAVSFRDGRLFALIEKFVREAGYRGQIDIDIFEVEGEYYISEVNPRFGGGYPHAYECGVDHMKLVMNNLRGVANDRNIGAYEEGVYMMKYNEVCIRKDGDPAVTDGR